MMMNERLYTPGDGWRKIKSLMNHKDGIGYIKTKEREGKGKTNVTRKEIKEGEEKSGEYIM